MTSIGFGYHPWIWIASFLLPLDFSLFESDETLGCEVTNGLFFYGVHWSGYDQFRDRNDAQSNLDDHVGRFCLGSYSRPRIWNVSFLPPLGAPRVDRHNYEHLVIVRVAYRLLLAYPCAYRVKATWSIHVVFCLGCHRGSISLEVPTTTRHAWYDGVRTFFL